MHSVLIAAFIGSALAASPIQARSECALTCWNTYNTCRSQPGANLSTCSSNYAGCLGYNPFGEDGSLVAPTACAHTTTQPPATTTTAAPAWDHRAKKCYDEYNHCRGAPNAHRPTCTSNFASCLGYNPFGSDGSLATPTACSHTVAPPLTTAPPEECHIKACTDKYNECRVKPGANQSSCAAEYAKCLGFNPFGEDGTLHPVEDCYHHNKPGNNTVPPVVKPSPQPPVVVSGAGDVQPANVLAVLAVGAVALL